jgi:hypothetical protein
LYKRINQADWQTVLEQLDNAYQEQGSEEAFGDMRDRLTEWIYEEADIPGDDTSEAIGALNQVWRLHRRAQPPS